MGQALSGDRRAVADAWEQFMPFLDYDPEIRQVLCSTNAIESLNARYRRAVSVRGHFPTEQAALKCLYMVTRSLDPRAPVRHDGPCGGSRPSTRSRSPSPTACPRPRTDNNMGTATYTVTRTDPIQLLAYVGLRWGEVAGLRVRALDMLRCRIEVVETVAEINGRLAVDSPKDHERRSVTMPAGVRDALAAHVVGKGPEDYVFAARNGSPLRSRTYRRDVFDQAARAAGIDGLVPHELRHTAAASSCPKVPTCSTVARQLGHADPSMTLRVYADLFDADLDALGVALDAAISEARADFLRTDRGLARVTDLNDRL